MVKGKRTSEITRDQILVAIEKLEAAVQAWEASADDGLLVHYRGRMVKQLSQSIEQAAMELFELCDTPAVSRDAWPLVLAIDVFDEELEKFADRYSVAPDATEPNGPSSLWAAYGNLIKAKTPPRVHKIEPIAQLLAENVDRRIIAKIYGWRRSDGTPDLDKLQEEISNPGTHYDPKTFVHPIDKRFWEEVEQKWLARVAAFEASEKDSRRAKPATEAPESLDDLIIQGVNAKQISKMKHVPVDEVQARAAELGIALDGSTIAYASYADAQRAAAARQQSGLQSSLAVATLNTHRELGDDQEARIRAMLTDGIAPKTVLDALKPQFPTMRYQDVATVITKMKKDTSASQEPSIANI
jgi:hypothetical protein